MDAREERLLKALAYMVQQYLRESGGVVDSMAMSAGEAAIESLAEYGLMEIVQRIRIGGRWTNAGKQIIESQ
jgi:hypothetical protein